MCAALHVCRKARNAEARAERLDEDLREALQQLKDAEARLSTRSVYDDNPLLLRRAEEAERKMAESEARLVDAMRQLEQAKQRQQEAQRYADEVNRYVKSKTTCHVVMW